MRACIPEDQEELDDVTDLLANNANATKLCSCTTLDLLMQVSMLLDVETRKQHYALMFKMFPSHHFKQCITISFASNYEHVIERTQESLSHTSGGSLKVQVLAQSEMTMIIFQNPDLRSNMLKVLKAKMKHFANNHESQDSYRTLWGVFHDLEYMARPKCTHYLINQTDWLQ